MLAEVSRQRCMESHCGIETNNGLCGCRSLVATVCVQANVGRQHCAKRFHVAVAGSSKESLGKLEAALFFHLEAWPCLAHMGARAACELATSGRVTLDGRRDFLESEPEHIVQQEGCTLERRKTFQ